MKKILIAAVSQNGVIGHKGSIPWKIPAEMNFFTKTTIGNVCIVGRKTFETDLNSVPLRNRTMIVVSRFLPPHYENYPNIGARLYTAKNISDAYDCAKGYNKIASAEQVAYIIGGAEIYRQTLPDCDELLISTIKEDFEGDAGFPSFDDNIYEKSVIKETDKFVTHKYRKLSFKEWLMKKD